MLCVWELCHDFVEEFLIIEERDEHGTVWQAAEVEVKWKGADGIGTLEVVIRSCDAYVRDKEMVLASLDGEQ